MIQTTAYTDERSTFLSADVETNRILNDHGERISAVEAVLQHLATKVDIESLRSELKAMRWLIGVSIGLASILLTVVNILTALALRA